MKTFKILSVAALTLTLMLQVTLAAVSVPMVNRLNESTGINGQMVRAILVNGDYMPVVDLPVVEIIAIKPGNIMVNGIIIKGEAIALVELPMVEITGNKIHPIANNTQSNYGEILDIPVIEIVGSFPQTHLISGVVSANEGIPVINLPEITITVDQSQEYKWIAFINESINMEESTDFVNPKMKLIIDQFNTENKMEVDLSLDIEKCLSLNNNTLVCEFVSASGYYASRSIKNGILKLIFKE